MPVMKLNACPKSANKKDFLIDSAEAGDDDGEAGMRDQEFERSGVSRRVFSGPERSFAIIMKGEGRRGEKKQFVYKTSQIEFPLSILTNQPTINLLQFNKKRSLSLLFQI